MSLGIRLWTVKESLALAVAMGLGIGWWAHGGNVRAATTTAPAQFTLNDDGSMLSVYYPGDHIVYVYPAQSGSENVYCRYSFRINGPGEAVKRENCPIGKLY